MSSLRHVQAGKKYEHPPQAPGIDPDSCAAHDAWKEIVMQAALQQQTNRQPGTVLAGCVRAFRGVSPALVSELCHAAGCHYLEPAQSLTDQQWEALHAQWQRWISRLQQRNFTATSCPSSGRYSLLGSYSQPEDSVLKLLGRNYTLIQAREQSAHVSCEHHDICRHHSDMAHIVAATEHLFASTFWQTVMTGIDGCR